MSLWSRITGLFSKAAPPPAETTVRGTTYPKPAAMFAWEHIGQLHDIRTKIEEIEALAEEDGQVKELHLKMARLATRGGVRFVSHKSDNKKMADIAEAWIKRVGLNEREVRKQHGVRLLMHGNLVIQNVISSGAGISAREQVEALIVMPTQTMRPMTDDKGQFTNPAKAYVQMDPMGMSEIASFARWQITWGALDKPADKLYGRPLIDAERKRAKQMRMTDDDLVIRRRVRAALRLLHILEGATKDEIEDYKNRNKDALENPLRVDSDLYSNKPGSVTPLQGDANLDQIKDVRLLNDKFYAGAGTSAHHFGLMAEDLNRDIFEDTLADLYERIEEIQEVLADCWEKSLRLEFLLNGINADSYEWDLKLEGRKVETPNQRLDRALKEQAIGLPLEWIVTDTLGLPWERMKELIDKEIEEMDPYGARIDDELNGGGDGKPPLKIVEGNQRGKQSAAYVRNSGT